MNQESFAFDSMFPSLYDGIRLGRYHRPLSDFRNSNTKEPKKSSSNFRIIPITVDHGENEKNTKVLNQVNPIILDDDLLEVVDCTTNNPSVSASPKNGYTFQKEYTSSHKNGSDITIIHDEDIQELVHLDVSSPIDSRCLLKKSSKECNSEETKTKMKSLPVEHLKLTMEPLPCKNTSRDNSCFGEQNMQLTGSIIIPDDPIDKSYMGVSNNLTSRNPYFSSMVSVEAINSHFEEVERSPPPNYPVYDKLMEKLILEERRIHYITGDGNCFFRALSKIIYGNELHHNAVRGLIIDIIATNKSKFAQFIDGENVQNHIDKMSKDYCWATTCEIYAAATVLQSKIFMLTPGHLDCNYSWLLFKPVFQITSEQSAVGSQHCYITLCNTDGIHYDLVVADNGKCNCFLPYPELDGISDVIDLT
uniref:OTU domain-containing protein n=1 Tax=Arion vulgaris TaxID=1028688 RepID=A0A0B7ANG8_9EUPU